MYNGRGGYPQQVSHARTDSGPPPAKKLKGNPIITRYPPPPGYTGPARPQGQPVPAWQPPAAQPPYGAPAFTGHSPQGYISPQSFQQPQWNPYPQQYQAQAYSPQGYYPPAAQAYPSPAHSWPSAPTPWNPPSASPLSSTPQSASSQQWVTPLDTTTFGAHAPHALSFPPSAQTPVSGVLDGNGDPFPAIAQGSSDDLLEDDFLGECYFARHPDEINPDLSLGLIEWKPAVSSKRALPATFSEAELEVLAPRKPLPSDDESVSEYFIQSKREETLLSVRQTELWNEVRHDLIFKSFPRVPPATLNIQELVAKYRDRHDDSWYSSQNLYSATPTPEPEDRLARPSIDRDVATNTRDHHRHHSRTANPHISEDNDVLGKLGKFNQTNAGHATGSSRKRKHSRASSTSSLSGQRVPRPRSFVPVRNQQQEDVLAALGVTGSPKTVYETPGPALGKAPITREGSMDPVSRTSSVSSNHQAFRAPPPPPPPPAPALHGPNYGSWNSGNPQSQLEPSHRPTSNHSERTGAGSDFDMADDNELTPRPKYSDNRKRTLADRFEDPSDSRRSEDQDTTPKPRSKVARRHNAPTPR